jgi:hypothetical protein
MQLPRKARESAEKRLVVNSDNHKEEDDLLFSGSGGSDNYTPPVDDGERDAQIPARVLLFPCPTS